MTDADNIIILPSVEAALAALASLRSEVAEAPTLAALDAVAHKASIIQRFAKVKEISDEGGAIWVEAEIKLGQELERLGTAKGRLLRGADSAPRENEAPTLAELGLPGDAGKRRSARDKVLANATAAQRGQAFEDLKAAGKSITPNTVATRLDEMVVESKPALKAAVERHEITARTAVRIAREPEHRQAHALEVNKGPQAKRLNGPALDLRAEVGRFLGSAQASRPCAMDLNWRGEFRDRLEDIITWLSVADQG